MSIPPTTLRKWRIIALPLTRPKKTTLSSATKPQILTFYHFQMTAPKNHLTNNNSRRERPWSKLIPEEGFAKWVTTKAADTWTGFGKANGGWKLKVYQIGERLVDRLEFEELALKGIDPSLRTAAARSNNPDKRQPIPTTIPLIYPTSINSGSVILDELRASVAHRTPRHRKGFYVWMIIAPFTAPFMVIPIIPNLPFFFCAWRAWSHYKAYKASQYLQTLLDDGAINPEANEDLDTIYKNFSPKTPENPTPLNNDSSQSDISKSASGSSSSASQSQHHEILLTPDAVPGILTLFGLKSNSGADMLRAVEQARVRVLSGRGIL